ncbi:porin [Thalassospira xiamenensis]|uniref:porin n=1 Tax=Thalassospira xiamenensis TaxID=220697 RepID=UPI000DEDF97E|nr:porin [Thalassospira xiamenensis]RCK40859.1 porin [Thalassospira xiamenensis]
MKKILVASSALAAVAFAGQASASEPIKLSVGGYMEQWAGFSDEDTTAAGGRPNAFQSDTEVHFKGSTTLDNGIEVGAVIELEGETSGDQVDEQYLYINGGFGQFKLGKDDSAADDMGITAPAVGPVGVNDGDMDQWTNAYLIDTVRSSGDQNRATYYTPVFGGFRAGVSFADDSNRNGATQIGGTSTYDNVSGSGDNIVSGGLEYNHDFGAVALGLSAVGENSGDGSWYGLGTNVGFGNFTVGGSYGHTEDDYGLNSRNTDLDAFDIGVSYSMDAAAVSLTYGYEDFGTGDISAVDLGLRYALGAGVSWRSSVFWFDQENDTTADNDGYGVVTGIRLDF